MDELTKMLEEIKVIVEIKEQSGDEGLSFLEVGVITGMLKQTLNYARNTLTTEEFERFKEVWNIN